MNTLELFAILDAISPKIIDIEAYLKNELNEEEHQQSPLLKVLNAAGASFEQVSAYLKKVTAKSPLPLAYREEDGSLSISDTLLTDRKFAGITIQNTLFCARGFANADSNLVQDNRIPILTVAWIQRGIKRNGFPANARIATQDDIELLLDNQKRFETARQCVHVRLGIDMPEINAYYARPDHDRHCFVNGDNIELCQLLSQGHTLWICAPIR